MDLDYTMGLILTCQSITIDELKNNWATHFLMNPTDSHLDNEHSAQLVVPFYN